MKISIPKKIVKTKKGMKVIYHHFETDDCKKCENFKGIYKDGEFQGPIEFCKLMETMQLFDGCKWIHVEKFIKDIRKNKYEKPFLLKGNSGLGVSPLFFHVSAPYDCNGKVFVKSKLTDDAGESVDSWTCVDKKDAKGKEIIPCCKCKRPAVTLDHHRPYDNQDNLCKEHYEKDCKEREARRAERRKHQ